MAQGHETINFQDQEVKVQGHTTLKRITKIHFSVISQELSDEFYNETRQALR